MPPRTGLWRRWFAVVPSCLLLSPRHVAASVREEEVAQLRCPVCELAVAEAHALFEELVVNRRIEDEVIDFVDNVCTLSKREGRWLRRLDVQSAPGDNRRLKVENMTDYGECRNECLTVRKACQAALKSSTEEFVDLLRADASVEALRKGVCRPACKKKVAPLKKDRVDEEWIKGADAGMLQMMENRDKLRQETGQVVEMMRREDMDTMSDGDKEAQAAQDAFAEELREAREMSGRNWRGEEM